QGNGSVSFRLGTHRWPSDFFPNAREKVLTRGFLKNRSGMRRNAAGKPFGGRNLNKSLGKKEMSRGKRPERLGKSFGARISPTAKGFRAGPSFWPICRSSW